MYIDFNKLDYIKVFINGDIIGYIENPDKLNKFRSKRKD